MKKIFYALSFFACILLSAQKKSGNIMSSNSIVEIENFLKEAHPDDSRVMLLKRKLISIKNDKWMNRGRTTFASTQPPINTQNSTNKTVQFAVSNPETVVEKNVTEEEEFQNLFSKTTKTHKEKTVKLLNQLFDNDITNDLAILLIKNKGACNMIVRILGNDLYNLAVPAHGENFLMVKKGVYQLSGKVCESKYFASKNIEKNMIVTLTKTSTNLARPQFGSNVSQ